MKLTHIITGFIVATLLGTYLAIASSLADSTLTGRFVFLSVCCLGGIALLLPRLKIMKIQVWELLFLGFYLLNLLSITWAHNFGEAVFTTQRYLLLFLSVVLFKSILAEHKKYLPQIGNVVAVVSLVALSVTTYQIFYLYGTEGLGGKNIYLINGWSGHKNLAASILFLLFGLNTYFLLSSKASKPWLYFLLVWHFLIIVLLRSRSVYLATALLGMLSFSAYLLSSPALRKMALRRILPGGVVLLAMGAAVLFGLGLADDYKKYLNPATYADSASAKERQFVWYKTKQLIADEPFLGYGSGNWKLFFPSKNVSGAYRIQEQDLVFTRAHNDYLEVATEVGIIGLVLYLSLFLLPLCLVAQAVWRVKPEYKLRWAILGSTLLGYLLIAYFDFPKERIEHQLFLGLLLAIIIYRSRAGIINKTLMDVTSQKKHIAVVLLGAFLLINIPIGYYRYVGEQASKEILRYKSTDRHDIIIENAVKGISSFYNVDGLVVPLQWYKGVSEYQAKNYSAALTSFREAYMINPYNFNVINNYGSALVQDESYTESIDVYLKALEINPKFEAGMFNLAFSYLKLEQFEEAMSWVDKVEKNTEKKKLFKNEILKFWQAQKRALQQEANE